MKFQETTTPNALSGKGTIHLVGDIGGTNGRFCFFQEQNKKLVPLVFFNLATKDFKALQHPFSTIVKQFKARYNRVPERSCFAVAGVVNDTKSKGTLTNQKLVFDAEKIKKQTETPVLIINDFEALAWGLDKLLPKTLVQIIKPSQIIVRELPPSKILLGAGTGLGKSILIWDIHLNRFIPSPSEGGHADFPAHTDEEHQLAAFITTNRKTGTHPLEWEDVLSGRGLQNIYAFLGATKRYRKPVIANDPHVIIKHHTSDEQCNDAVSLFIKFYGRCAKNFSLNTLAFGGVYLAGGIAMGNPTLFKGNLFKQEFLLHATFKKFLAKIPVYVLTDPYAGLVGAAAYSQYSMKP